MADGITTHVERVPADAGLAARQHEAYVDAVAQAGWTIREVPTADDLPDCAFVEDTVAVFGDLAVLARPGAIERRAEIPATHDAVGSLGLAVARTRTRARSMAGTSCRWGTRVRGPRRRTDAEGIRELRRLRLPGNVSSSCRAASRAAPEIGGDGAARRHLHPWDASLFDPAPFATMRLVPEEAGSHVA